jgi:hypothetical protein
LRRSNDDMLYSTFSRGLKSEIFLFRAPTAVVFFFHVFLMLGQ